MKGESGGITVIVVIDYGMGNLGSIVNMLKKVGAQAAVSSEAEMIERADRLILPGVGAFDNAIKNLTDRGLIPLLNTKVVRDKTPILGVCLGMQLLAQRSEEGHLPGLGWLDAEVIRFKFDPAHAHLKIPHMGWNTLQICQPHPLWAELDAEPRFYFVHSYHLACRSMDTVLAQTHYGYAFTSAVAKENILGVQFHPEKSHKFGMRLLNNFAKRC
jgi:glutamine amidotransferase